jgi:Spy/CpxP family protein refolding chaperone
MMVVRIPQTNKGTIMSSNTKQGLMARFGKFGVVLAFAAGAASAVGVGALAGTDAVAIMHGQAATPEARAKHVDAMIARFYQVVDATDVQKTQLDPILRQVAADMPAAHAQLQTAHQQLATLLTQSTVDRAALEVFRQQQMQALDQLSKKLVQTMADVGDVLTPAQRQALASHMQQMHQGHAGHHG